jgi:hypothetical protein
MASIKPRREVTAAIPHFGRDEMNLIEFPFGPITRSGAKTLEVEHKVFDRSKKREVKRRLIITGSDAFGLPRPVDEQVLVGMKALTYDAGYGSRKVEFSGYHLCRTIGWKPDGRAYRRLEESFDRIAGTTLKFLNAWWDKSEREWKSKTFHLVDEVELCSRDRMERTRARIGGGELRLCHFVWNEIVWKSFEDGFIKAIDMEMYRRIARGRRREVPLRLFRILDKRLHGKALARFDLRRLCVGILGLDPKYCPSEMARVLDRAVGWLVECGYLVQFRFEAARHRGGSVVFERQARAKSRREYEPASLAGKRASDGPSYPNRSKGANDEWLSQQSESELLRCEGEALELGFGTELERRLVLEERSSKTPVLSSSRIRRGYVRKYIEHIGASPRGLPKCGQETHVVTTKGVAAAQKTQS